MSITPVELPEITLDGQTVHQVTEQALRYVDFNTLLLTVHKNPRAIHLGLIILIADRSYEVKHLAYAVDVVGNVQKLIVDFITKEDDPKPDLEETPHVEETTNVPL